MKPPFSYFLEYREYFLLLCINVHLGNLIHSLKHNIHQFNHTEHKEVTASSVGVNTDISSQSHVESIIMELSIPEIDVSVLNQFTALSYHTYAMLTFPCYKENHSIPCTLQKRGIIRIS